MGFRFRKSFKIARGVRLNVSKSGFGISIGGRGGRVGIGPRGAYASAGIPGTGIYMHEYLGANRHRSTPQRRSRGLAGFGGMSAEEVARQLGEIQVALQEDGSLVYTDVAGEPVPAEIVRIFVKQNQPRIREWLEEQCARVNGGTEAILNVHLTTPQPGSAPGFALVPFQQPPPAQPVEVQVSWLDRLISGHRARLEHRNAVEQARHEQEYQVWEEAQRQHEEEQARASAFHNQVRGGDREAMLAWLEHRLSCIEWPRETNISLEILEEKSTIYLDVDLPELEDMPTQEARLGGRGDRLVVKARSETQRRKEYMLHVHAVAFRMIGEVFAALPSVASVVISGYSQRLDPSTGKVRDEYLYSVAVDRAAWQAINFNRLADLDVVPCLEGFDLRRNMTKTGVFRPIEPITPSAA